MGSGACQMGRGGRSRGGGRLLAITTAHVTSKAAAAASAMRDAILEPVRVWPDWRPNQSHDAGSSGGRSGSKDSTAGPEMGSSPLKSSIASRKPTFSMPTGATHTRSTDRSVASATNHPRASPRPSATASGANVSTVGSHLNRSSSTGLKSTGVGISRTSSLNSMPPRSFALNATRGGGTESRLRCAESGL